VQPPYKEGENERPDECAEEHDQEVRPDVLFHLLLLVCAQILLADYFHPHSSKESLRIPDEPDNHGGNCRRKDSGIIHMRTHHTGHPFMQLLPVSRRFLSSGDTRARVARHALPAAGL
jgi:hypothetical protein